MSRVLILSLLVLSSHNLYAWGERGHDAVARVAARLAKKRNLEAYSHPFESKELMLGHLANVPDFSWKSIENVSKEDYEQNTPTHYIDLEYLSERGDGKLPSYKTFPRSIIEAKKRAKINGKDFYKEVGSAPWRVEQLYSEMVQSLKKISGRTKINKFNKSINEALLYAGILSHFTGDLGQPQHNSSNYDGKDTQQGGLHAYFETLVVSEMELGLSKKVYKTAEKDGLLETLFKNYPKARESVFELALAFSYNSHARLDRLLKLDKKHAVIALGKDPGLKALRKKPREVISHFEPLIIERLALAALVTEHLWHEAWREAGSPDMSSYLSYKYYSEIEFIQRKY